MRAVSFAARVCIGGSLALGLVGCADSKMMAPAIDDQLPPASAAAPMLAKNSSGQITWIGDTSQDQANASPVTPNFDNLEIVNASLKDKLSVLRIGSQRSDSNLLSVFAGVKNQTGHVLDLEMQTIYRDKDGQALTGHGSWIPITLKPHEETQYRSVAISEDATDFVVRIRHAQSPEQASR